MPDFADLYGRRLDIELGTNDSVVLFTTARRKAAINEGLREFADLTECWQRESSITCSNAVATYSLVSTVNVPGGDFLRLLTGGPEYRYTDASSYVTYRSGQDDLPRRDLEWLNSHEPGWRASTGATFPVSYYLDMQDGAQVIGLYPPPTLSSVTSAKLIVHYVARPSSLSSDTAVPFTDTAGQTRSDLTPYHQAAVHFAASQLEKLRKNTEDADRQMQLAMGYVQRYLSAMRPKAGRSIRPAKEYFSRAHRDGDDSPAPTQPWWR